MLHMIALLALLLIQLINHDKQLLLLLLLLVRRQLHVVLERIQLLLQARLLLIVRRRRHKAVIHRQRPERRVEQRAHVLPHLRTVQAPHQINDRLHDTVNRLQIALRLTRLVHALGAAVQFAQFVVPGEYFNGT